MTLYIEAGFDLALLTGKLSAPFSCVLTETGGGGATGSVSLTSGTHFLRTNGTTLTKPDPDDGTYALGYSAFTTALKAALEVVGNATYTVTFDPVTERITISAAGGGVTAFALGTFSSVAQRVIGFTTNRSLGMSYVADRAPYYWIKCSEGGLTEYFWNEEEEGDLGEDLKSHGADTYAVAEDELPMLFDARVPLEPKAKLWTTFASATVPFTWERLFRHARNVEPVLFDLAHGTITKKSVVRFRREGRLFKPIPRQSKNVWTYGDVPILARLVGTL